jgi:hypothetical protein
MAKSKKDTAVQPPAETPPPVETIPPTDVPIAHPAEPAANGVPNGEAPANGEKRKPVVSWRFPTDGTTNVQVALWPGEITLRSGEKVEVLTLTIQRSYLDTRVNEWVNGSKSFRVHDLPVLIHALQKAHAYALDRREQEVPF